MGSGIEHALVGISRWSIDRSVYSAKLTDMSAGSSTDRQLEIL